MKKRLNHRGETLTETLVSILILTLSGLLLLTATMAANKVNQAAVKMDADLREQLQYAEMQRYDIKYGAGTGRVTVNGEKYDVTVYSHPDSNDPNKLQSYSYSPISAGGTGG